MLLVSQRDLFVSQRFAVTERAQHRTSGQYATAPAACRGRSLIRRRRVTGERDSLVRHLVVVVAKQAVPEHAQHKQSRPVNAPLREHKRRVCQTDVRVRKATGTHACLLLGCQGAQ